MRAAEVEMITHFYHMKKKISSFFSSISAHVIQSAAAHTHTESHSMRMIRRKRKERIIESRMAADKKENRLKFE